MTHCDPAQIGTCTLYNDDCMDVLPTLGAGSVDFVLTDPPYMVAMSSIGDVRAKTDGWADMNNAAWLYAKWYRMCHRLLSDTGVFATFANWRSIPMVLCALARAKMPATSCVIWDKEWIGPAPANAFRSTYEVIVFSAKPRATIMPRSQSDIIRRKWMAAHSGQTGHPAEKPVDLAEVLIRAVSPKVLLDPFAGSGTFLLAAAKLGVRSIGIEMDNGFFEMARARLAGHFGSLAEVAT